MGSAPAQRPGRLHRFDVTDAPLPAEIFNRSTHSLGLPEAVELARELDRLPTRLIVYGIEGESFETGEGLSDPVQTTVEKLVAGPLPRAQGAARLKRRGLRAIARWPATAALGERSPA